MSALPLETARLDLSPPRPTDVEDFLALDSDPEVMRYIGDGAVNDDPEYHRQLLAKVIAVREARPELGLQVVRERGTGSFVGWAALKPLDRREEIEVGYRLMRRAWGQGYATELARALVDHGFEALGLEQIVGITHPDNGASQRVLEKAGLSRVGTDHCYGCSVWRYELDRGRWQELRAD